jgi:hypothetical protein
MALIEKNLLLAVKFYENFLARRCGVSQGNDEKASVFAVNIAKKFSSSALPRLAGK